MPTFYQLLALPSTATRDEIRGAYRRQRSRVARGELPAALTDSLDTAYAVLDHPDRRLAYDLQLGAAALQSARSAALYAQVATAVHRVADAVRMPVRIRFADSLFGSLTLQAGGLIALSAVMLLAGIRLGSIGPVRPKTSTVSARAVPPAVLPTAPATTTEAPVAPAAPPSDVGADQSADEPVDSGTASTPAPVRTIAAPRPQAVARPLVSYRAAEYPTQEEPAPPQENAEAMPQPTVDTTADTPADTPAATPAAPAHPAVTTVTIVRTRPVTGERDVTMIVGRYCRDSSGGEVFTPINAPTDGLTC